jgi:hypothetical protein
MNMSDTEKYNELARRTPREARSPLGNWRDETNHDPRLVGADPKNAKELRAKRHEDGHK